MSALVSIPGWLKGFSLKRFAFLKPTARTNGQSEISPKLQFKSEKEFVNLVTFSKRSLFGLDSILFDATNLIGCHVLIDFLHVGKPTLSLVVFDYSKVNPWFVFMKITKIMEMYSELDFSDKVTKRLADYVTSNVFIEEQLKSVSTGNDFFGFFNSMLVPRPNILVLSDVIREEFRLISDVYNMQWGMYVKQLEVKKLNDSGHVSCYLYPSFTSITKLNGKPVLEHTKKQEKLTEESHLAGVSDLVKEIYTSIKNELLQVDASLEFNAKQYYISLKKNKNLAFFQIGKKRISIVVLHPEKDTKKVIKDHEVKTLTEKVQKFWNGPSCTIVIDNMDNLDEVIALLKKLVQ